MIKLTPHFSDEEFKYSHPQFRGINPVMDMDFLHLLEAFRQWLGLPLIVTPNGGYRPEAFNNNPHSMHILGRAADIYCPKLELGELMRKAAAFQWVEPWRQVNGEVVAVPDLLHLRRFGGIGLYPQNHFLHVDNRESVTTWVRIGGDYLYF